MKRFKILSKRFYLLFPVLFAAAELTLICSILLTAQWLVGEDLVNRTYYFSLTFSFISWALIFFYTKDYKIGRNAGYSVTFNRSIRFVSLFIAVFAILLLFNISQELPKSYIASFFALLLCLLPAERVLIHFLLNKYREYGGNFRSAVIIGYDNLGTSLFSVLSKNPYYGIRCLGFYDNNEDRNQNNQVLGSVSDFLKSSLDKVDLVYVSEKIDRSLFNEILWYAETNYKKVKLLPSFKPEQLRSYQLSVIDNVSIVDINSLPLDGLFNRFVKRSFDIFFASLVFVLLLSWLFPLIAILIKLESRGPILFKQLRNGKNNHPFFCYKFRTMVENNEADTKWATKNDPRITRLGSFLRKTSIDELPQFLNVLVGDMAIVGPRPLPIKLNEQYRNQIENFVQRHSYKPGITGLAQAMGYRGEIRELSQIKD
ncbi:MAG: putative colanic acid biosynthesis UDP-glucose lipid carrier transferase, partial [Parvicella sp.]